MATTKNKFAFYSAIFTEDKTITEPIQSFKKIDNWDYILFTNTDIQSDSWTVKKIDLPNKNTIVSAKIIKWQSHLYLADYDVVFWMDAFCKFNNRDINVLEAHVKKLFRMPVPLFIYKHPSRDCIYNEVNACVQHKKITFENSLKVSEFLKEKKMPANYGLYQTQTVLKLNNSPIVKKIGNELIHYIKTLTYRDQLILTYILFNNNIKSLDSINKNIFICNARNVSHKYVDKEQRVVAICFWGIMRSLKCTLPSIQKYIFKPLDDAKIHYDIFLHTFNIPENLVEHHSSNYNGIIDNNEYKLLNPKEAIIENQDEIDKLINLKKYTTKGSPWYIHGKPAPMDVFYNHIRALWSLKQVTSLYSKNLDKYSHVIYCRPDITYIMPIQLDWLVFSNEIYTPDFAIHGRRKRQICDRFAIGMPEQMEIYGNRFNDAYKFSKKYQLHSETFLGYTLDKHNIPIHYVPFGFIRTRAGCILNNGEDIKESMRKRWITRKRANKLQKSYTRRAQRFYKTK